jgi:Domain of unknown function (DUF4440)
MKTLTLVLLLIIPLSAQAQEWTTEQQEVLDHIQACWDAWETKVYDNWVEVCRPAKNELWWTTSEALPGNLEYDRKLSEAQWKTSEIEYLWNEIRPLAVQIHGDVALVYFYALFSWTEDGEEVSAEQKRFEAFRKVDGQWMVIGGMVVPTN